MFPVEVLAMDLDLQAQNAAEAHLEACWAWLDDDGPEPDMAGPFCGCATCLVRETLHAAWPYLRQLALVEPEAT